MIWLTENLLNIIGLLFTIFGFVITIWQIQRTKKIALLSKEIAEETKNLVYQNSILIDITKNIELILVLKGYLKNEKYELLLIKHHELHCNLIQIKNIPQLGKMSVYGSLKEILPLLSIMKKTIEDYQISPEKKINVKKHLDVYNELSDILNQILGELKYGA